MPEFSFIVPLKNGESTIEKCLTSIVSQTGDFEVIVVNNGSTDRGVEIARTFNRVGILSCKTPGPGAARNFGSQFARGKYLVFIDADVELSSDWLSEVRDYLWDSPMDLLATTVVPAGSDGLVDEFRYFFAYFKSHGQFLSIRKRHTLAPVVNTAASVCLSSSFVEAGKFNEDLKHNEDLDLSVRMFFKGMNIGACSKATAKVEFRARFRMFAYLRRTFVKRSHSLMETVPFLESVLPQLRVAKKKSLSLKLFIIFNEMAGQAGEWFGRLNPRMKKIRNSVRTGWKIKLGRKFERFHFDDGESHYYPRKDHFFLFLDESVHLLKFPGLASQALGPDIAPALRKLNRGFPLNEGELTRLRALETFQT
ncbi:MAG: glycosyltransferase family 2 protein [Bdellovibrionota bacterium]